MKFLSLVACLLLFPFLLHADADRQDWIGEYAMNHDGHTGTLRISPSRRKCRSRPCPALDVQYTDDHGSLYDGSVDRLDQNGQHMAFTVDFPGNPQVFDVYIFSFDKSKIAGTTVWGGRTFGVLATKSDVKLAGASQELGGGARRIGAMMGERVRGKEVLAGASTSLSGGPTRVLLPDGSIELHYPDGTVRTKRIGACGWSTRYPDGRVVPAMCTYAAVIPVIPPPPPTNSPEERWLKGQDDALLTILQKVLGGANSSDFQNYTQAYENPADPLLYKRIYFRTRAIAELTSTPQ